MVTGEQVASDYIAAWGGTDWRPLDSSANGRIGAVGAYGHGLSGGTFFDRAGTVPANAIARWRCPHEPGDMTWDGVLDFGDINPFAALLGGR